VNYERKKSKTNTLEISEDIFRLLFENKQERLVVFDAKGGIIYANEVEARESKNLYTYLNSI